MHRDTYTFTNSTKQSPYKKYTGICRVEKFFTPMGLKHLLTLLQEPNPGCSAE